MPRAKGTTPENFAAMPKNKFTKGDPRAAEAAKKGAESRMFNRMLKTEVYDELRRLMLEGKEGSEYFKVFMKKYLDDAKKNPTGKAGQMVAGIIFQPNLLDTLDKDTNTEMDKNRDFVKFRIFQQFYDKQRDILSDINQRRKLMAITSRRTGKTTTASGAIVLTATTPNSPIIYINLTFTNAISQMFDMVVERSESIGLSISKKSKSEGIIEWSNGSSLKLTGNSNSAEADKLRGSKARLVIVDEIGHQKNIEYLLNEVLYPQMVDYPDSTILLIGTPSRVPHHFSTKMWEEDNTFKKFHFTMFDNPFITKQKEFVEELCKAKGLTIDSPFIQREYYGKFAADTEALVFKGFTTYKDIPADFIPTDVVIGCDYGYTDYNGIVSLAYNKKKKQAYVIRESKFNKAPVSTIIDTVKEHYANAVEFLKQYDIKSDNVKIFADTNEESITKELLINHKLPAFNCYKYDKAYAIEKLSECSRTGLLKVPEAGFCSTEMEMTLYKRDEEDNVIAEIDDDTFHPDILMALLYASRQMFFDMDMDVAYKPPVEENSRYNIASNGDIIMNGLPQATPTFKNLGTVG